MYAVWLALRSESEPKVIESEAMRLKRIAEAFPGYRGLGFLSATRGWLATLLIYETRAQASHALEALEPEIRSSPAVSEVLALSTCRADMFIQGA